MKKIFLLLLTLVVATAPVNADSNLSPAVHLGLLNDYKPDKIAAHTYVIHGPVLTRIKESKGFINNPAFIIGNESVLVIDPGSSVQIGRAVLAHIRRLTDKPVTHVLITHIHGDHWLGNQAFREANPDVKIYANPNMIEQAHAGSADKWLNRIRNLTGNAIQGTATVVPAERLFDGMEIKAGDITVKAYLFHWAHTRSDAMFQIVEDKVIFTGDIVNNGRFIPFGEDSFRGSIDAIQKVMSLPIEHVVPGHGKSGGNELLVAYGELLSIIYNKVRFLTKEGLQDYEMKQSVLSGLAAYQDWDRMNEEIGRYINSAMLEAEQEEFQ